MGFGEHATLLINKTCNFICKLLIICAQSNLNYLNPFQLNYGMLLSSRANKKNFHVPSGSNSEALSYTLHFKTWIQILFNQFIWLSCIKLYLGYQMKKTRSYNKIKLFLTMWSGHDQPETRFLFLFPHFCSIWSLIKMQDDEISKLQLNKLLIVLETEAKVSNHQQDCRTCCNKYISFQTYKPYKKYHNPFIQFLFFPTIKKKILIFPFFIKFSATKWREWPCAHKPSQT